MAEDRDIKIYEGGKSRELNDIQRISEDIDRLGVASPYGEVRFGRQGALGSGVNGSIFLNMP